MNPAPDNVLLVILALIVVAFIALELLYIIRVVPETVRLLRNFVHWLKPKHWKRIPGLPLRAASQIEEEFSLRFPAHYRKTLTNPYPLKDDCTAFVIEEERLRSWNWSLRENDSLRDVWCRTFWWIGLDGKAGFYFFDTREDDSRVYHCDDSTDAAAISDALSRPEPFEDFLRVLCREKRKPPAD